MNKAFKRNKLTKKNLTNFNKWYKRYEMKGWLLINYNSKRG